MTPRRILVVVRHAVGGIRTYLKYVCRGLPRDRYRFLFVAVDSEEAETMAADFRDLDTRFRFIREQSLSSLGRSAFAAALRWKPDAVHSHGFTAAVAAVPAAFCLRIPHIVTSHNMFADSDFEGAAGGLKRRALAFALNRTDLIQVVSDAARQNTIDYLPSLNSSLLRVVRNGVPPPSGAETPDGAAWRREVAAGAEVLLGFFGRFMPEKGFDVLVDAVERLSKRSGLRRFRVLAINDGSYVREYRAKIARMGLSDYFSFLGFVPNARRLMASVDAVVMPSLREACPLVAMEAMGEGAPFVSTRIPSVVELCSGAPALLVPPGDGASLADALAAVIASPEAHRNAARAFAGEAQRRFDVAGTVTGLERLYDELLSGR